MVTAIMVGDDECYIKFPEDLSPQDFILSKILDDQSLSFILLSFSISLLLTEYNM